ncbi:hypothetical protein FRC15_001316 [Serendipita sp. 397]|nr:hypothetical protein FRC15_001316 [Serendipita sp. 397]KAG8800046.1 hypothetical protein FRC16_003819 [Serendipita sp. 398]
MAYRERSRHVPSPLNLGQKSPPPLLYDLPASAPLSPSLTSGAPYITPKSPKSPPRTPRGRAQALHGSTPSSYTTNYGPKSPVSNMHHPQPSSSSQTGFSGLAQSRSTAGTPTHEMEAFAALCRAWYFQQDAHAGTQMQETLRTAPASQRAAYTRLQAQIRSSYHASVALRRESEFHAHLTSTKPGQSLTPLHRKIPLSDGAKLERLERLEKFLGVWATSGNIGTRPFLDGLFAILRLQALPEKLGGAGGRRLAWEIDDAVFKESAGKEFMLDAIDILKGVLGFEESLPAAPNGLPPSSTTVVDLSSKPSSPPPLPSRPRSSSRTLDSGHKKGRSSLATISTTSAINKRRDSTVEGVDDSRNYESQVVVLDDEEGDTFADPVSPQASRKKPKVPPRRRNPSSSFSTTSLQDAQGRNRSHSDPFADTHGHLPYGHGHRGSRTQASLGPIPTAPSPSLTPLLVGGGSSVGTGTTGESILAEGGKGIVGTSSQPKRNVPLPPEDFELDVTHTQSNVLSAERDALDSEDDDTHDPTDQDRPRSGAFGLGFIGKSRRGSESTGLGLLGASKGSASASGEATPINATASFSRPKSHIMDDQATITGEQTSQLQKVVPSTLLGLNEGMQYMRTWLVPAYLGNAEINKLLGLFPPSISRGSIPRFRGGQNKSRLAKRSGEDSGGDIDLEAQVTGMVGEEGTEYVRCGTGRMFVSGFERGPGWRGSMWERFVGWWRRVFC